MRVIPLTFVLGFYVTFVLTRWWQWFLAIPWPDQLALQLVNYVRGDDERARLVRRTVVRYALLAMVLVLQLVSSAVRKRLPTLEHVVQAGLMTDDERKACEALRSDYPKWWLPVRWALNVLAEARDEGRIADSILFDRLCDAVIQFRAKLALLLVFDWICVPLVYTQVVNVAVHSYFLVCLIARQYLDPAKHYAGHDLDLYFPPFTTLEFLFYVGWMKVAEVLLNPLGEDVDDFDINWILDRNIQLVFLIVDVDRGHHCPLKRDAYWHMGVDEIELPYTVKSMGLMTQEGMNGSMERYTWFGPFIPNHNCSTDSNIPLLYPRRDSLEAPAALLPDVLRKVSNAFARQFSAPKPPNDLQPSAERYKVSPLATPKTLVHLPTVTEALDVESDTTNAVPDSLQARCEQPGTRL